MKSLLLIHLLFISCKLFAQSGIDHVLAEIKKNNKTIHATQNYVEAQNYLNRTGITLRDPFAEIDYLQASPTGAGNETEIRITQSFDFPTVYSKRKQLAELRNKKSDYYLNEITRDVLLEVKLICFELIYLHKLLKETYIRKTDTERWVRNFEAALDKGEGNILDLNKAKLQLIEVNSELRNVETNINQLNQQLIAMNGGNEIVFTDTIYPEVPAPFSLPQLLEEISVNDPLRNSLEQEINIASKQIELQKYLWLPEFEAGYLYRTLLNETFNGIHFGLSIPLWENNYSVKAAKATKNYAEENLQQHVVQYNFRIKEEYENYINLSATLAEYQNLFSTANNAALLDKALGYGEITVFEYFNETVFYYQALQNFLKTENEYYQSLTKLYSYLLIN